MMSLSVTFHPIRTRQQDYLLEERPANPSNPNQYDSQPLPEKTRLVLQLTMAAANAESPFSAHVEARLGKKP